MKTVFSKPKSMYDVKTHYCPGCGHGVAHRIMCEVIDELNIREKVIAIAPVGCSVIAYDYWDFDVSEAPHGRGPAVATGLKKVHPESIVISYQGDGDLASIGIAETIHAANRGENFTIIFINNANYGMTGGQLAPTTLIGQKTLTTPFGRSPEKEGYPINVCKLLNALKAPVFIARAALTTPKKILKAKSYIKTAFKYQMQSKGFTFIELLSACPTNWGRTPSESIDFIETSMISEFEEGIFRDLKEN